VADARPLRRDRPLGCRRRGGQKVDQWLASDSPLGSDGRH